MVRSKLAKLEQAAQALGGGRCPTCLDGQGPSFIVNRVRLEGGGYRDEPWPSEVYDAQGRCRTCGRECSDGIILDTGATQGAAGSIE